nr:hypothetical protein [uncultured bacterium]
MLSHDLERSIQALVNKSSSQNRMTIDHSLPGLPKGFNVEFSLDSAACLIDVNFRVRRVERMKEHPLLHRGKRIHVFDILHFVNFP